MEKFMSDDKGKAKADESAGTADKCKPRSRKYGESYMYFKFAVPCVTVYMHITSPAR
jgi:hypothetical protein